MAHAQPRTGFERLAGDDQLLLYGMEPSHLTAGEFARFSAAESAKWFDVMKRAHVEPY